MEKPVLYAPKPTAPVPVPRYSSLIPRRGRHKSLSHTPTCRCIRCFMKMEERAIEDARKDQEKIINGTALSSGQSTPLSTRSSSPVLVLDWTQSVAEMMSQSQSPPPVERESASSSVSGESSILTSDLSGSAPPSFTYHLRPSSAPPMVDLEMHGIIRVNISEKDCDEEDDSSRSVDRSSSYAESNASSSEFDADVDDVFKKLDMEDEEQVPMVKITSADSFGDDDEEVKSARSEELAEKVGMMKSKEGYYIAMQHEAIEKVQDYSGDEDIDNRYSCDQLVAILRQSGFRVPSRFGHDSPSEAGSSAEKGYQLFNNYITPVADSPPHQGGYGTPYVPMPSTLYDRTSTPDSPPMPSANSSMSKTPTPPIVIPQLYSLKRPGSPDIPKPMHTSRTQQEIQKTFRELQVKLDGVKGHEQNLTPASSPRPHHSRRHGSAIADRRSFFCSIERNPQLSARISPMLRIVLENNVTRSRSQDLLESNRNKSSVSVRAERAQVILALPEISVGSS